MKQIVRSKILKKCLILFVLIIGLAFVSGEQTARPIQAAACCEDCDASFDECRAFCGGNAVCLRECRDENFSCLEHCVMCGSGGGGGGACLTNNDCAYIPGYGFGNCVGGNCVY